MFRIRQRLSARRHRPDYSLVLLTGLLLLIGLIVIFSIGPALQQSVGISVSKQFISILLGVIGFGITATVPLEWWHKLIPVLAIITAFSLLLLMLPGIGINPDINGATRWIVIGSFSFQPSELLKFTLVIFLASWLSKKARQNELDSSKAILPTITYLLLGLTILVAFFQSDLGTTLVLVGIIFTMLYVSGIRFKILKSLILAALGAGLAAVLVAPHRIARLFTFINPGTDIEGAGYHINQALIAIGSGGIFGLGLGKSIQSYGYLPEAANDSIFAVFAEKFGFIGSLVILVLLGALMVRIVHIINHSPNMYMRLIAAGVFAWLFAHTVINVGAMLNLLPLTGITLPFLSYGGSSLIFTMASLGLLFNISRYTVLSTKKGNNAHSHYRRGNGGSPLTSGSSNG